ncbi:MAG: Fic family protein [Flavobacteriaceae bacterium]|jgi:Fic family protein|nr:Fic family protein [Flavobacteriaceae bacterium]
MQTYAPIFTITPEILNAVYEIAADLERIDIIREKALTPQLRKENRIKTIHSSLWIEANSLTLAQVTDIVNGKRVSGPKKDILEVKNAIVAYDELLERNPYQEKDLLKQHELLMNELISDAGKYRNSGVGVFDGEVPVHIAPPHQRVPMLMSQLLDWAENAKLPQVVKSCIFHYEFEFIHPFSDGNGRMGRMWQTLLLYRENPVFAWLPIETVIAQNQQEYYRALRRSTHHNDSGIFAQFMLTAIKQATAEFKEKYQKGEIGNADVNASVNAGVKLSKLQEKIIALIAKNGNISQSEIAKKLKINASTVYRNIEKLKQLEIIERKGSDKTGVWVVK